MKTLKITSILFLLVALVGFVDATYLTVQHFIGVVPPCLITKGCSTVLTSQWSAVGPVPISLLGAIYYLVLIVLALAYLSSGKKRFLTTAAFGTFLGFIASLWLFGLQLFIIKDLCFYCLISGLTSTILFIIGLFIFRQIKKLPVETTLF